MTIKDIKEKIYNFTFPEYKKTYDDLLLTYRIRGDLIKKQDLQIGELELELIDLKQKPTPSMADLMREVLGITSLNIGVTETDGYPKHFLDTYTPAERDMLTAQLHQIQSLDVWKAMTKYHIDKQGNFIVKHADGDTQMLSGRMVIAGIRLIEDEVLAGHNEYLDRSKPPDEFDKFSVDLLNEPDQKND